MIKKVVILEHCGSDKENSTVPSSTAGESWTTERFTTTALELCQDKTKTSDSIKDCDVSFSDVKRLRSEQPNCREHDPNVASSAVNNIPNYQDDSKNVSIDHFSKNQCSEELKDAHTTGMPAGATTICSEVFDVFDSMEGGLLSGPRFGTCQAADKSDVKKTITSQTLDDVSLSSNGE